MFVYVSYLVHICVYGIGECIFVCVPAEADLRGAGMCSRGRGEAVRPRGAVCFGLFGGDGLLECPYCAADHFTTLRAHEKKLFTGTWALAGITGSVLTGCHLLF